MCTVTRLACLVYGPFLFVLFVLAQHPALN